MGCMKLCRLIWMVIAAAACAAPTSGAEKKSRPVTKSVAEIATAITPSLVKIIQVGREGMDGLGAGFVVAENGLIATNKHVIGEARRIQVETSDGEKHDVVEVFASDAHLDLAIVRIEKTGMKPLTLGDSSKVTQGESVVGMGNPQGLAFSVVQGVVSAIRDVDDVPMIQIAMPIERGNSGGPLLDRKGRVLGLLTLKSQKTENLGFAMPVDALKKLVAKPNPVPMARWLTIGVLDRRAWSPILGGQWSQRAGVIKSSLPGEGFGGRSICLWIADEPPAVFEASVTVKLDDESGAAGIAFCADQENRHYGFYATGGKVRLTRFEGPDIYSWTVLAEMETDAYKKGDWNSLRVRVDDKTIKCLVNGRQVLEQEDAILRGGRVGLCKFRSPVAEFKSFRFGADLTERQVDPQFAESVKKAVGSFLGSRDKREDVLDQLLAEPAAARRILVDQRKSLEQDASALKDLERDLHRRSITRELLKQLAKDEGKIDLLRCALLVSKHDNPEIDVEQCHRSFERLANEIKADVALNKGTGEAVKRISRFLFQENGFHGSRHDYANNSNSYINEVIDDREGLPITLSILFLEMAKRLKVDNVFGLGLPGQFMVGYRPSSDEEDIRIIDVFDGGKEISQDAAAALIDAGSSLPAEYLKPAEPKEIVIRLVRNLLRNAQEDEDTARAAGTKSPTDSMPYLNLLLAIKPDAPAERFTRAMLRDTRGDKGGAREDVGWLISHPPEGLPASEGERLNRWLRSLSGEG